MISGAHMVIYTKDAEADRAFFRDVLEFPWVDARDGWLIFALPPAEVACHPDKEGGRHEMYLMCDDVVATVAWLTEKEVGCEEIKDTGWGLLTRIELPGGGKMGLYQPRHPLAPR